MARKDKLSNRERELGNLLHFERYIENFLQRYSRPRQRFPKLQAAFEEIREERLLLEVEMGEGLPPLRRTRRAITVDDSE
jgi:hypothetical protein